VILPRVRVGERCVIRRAIIDEGSLIPDDMQIGVDPAYPTASASTSPRTVSRW